MQALDKTYAAFTFRSGLFCFKTRVCFVNDVDAALTANDFAIAVTAFEGFERGSDFHDVHSWKFVYTGRVDVSKPGARVNVDDTAKKQFRGYNMKLISIKRTRWVLAASIAGLLTSCAAGPIPDVTFPEIPFPLPDGTGDTGGGSTTPDAPFATSGHKEFDLWRDDFAARARSGGRDPEIVRSLLAGLEPLDLYLGSSVSTASVGVSDQAEFAKPIWEYLRTAVSPARANRRALHVSQVMTRSLIQLRAGMVWTVKPSRRSGAWKPITARSR